MNACNRPKMAVALAVDTCCATMIAASPAKASLPAAKRRRPADRDQVLDEFRVFGQQALGGSPERRLIVDRGTRMVDPFLRRTTFGAPGCLDLRLRYSLSPHGR